ncbi:MAG: butyrate kinase [Candidatus Zixiibacteriota bacterium]
MKHRILSINPGATSTKVAIYENEKPIKVESIRHNPADLSSFNKTIDQLACRKKLVLKFLQKNKIKIENLSAVVGRGGPFKPLFSGTYRVNQKMLSDVRSGNVQADHVSNLGCLLAYDLTRGTDIPAFIVDPVSVDEFPPVARISGLPELPRKSLSHALNIKMVARKAAKKLGQEYEKLNLIIVHLGSGISVTSHQKGRMIDVNNANDGGPFSPQRVGSIPVTGLAKLCVSGKYNWAQIYERLTKKGGLLAHLGTDDLEEVERRIKEGDEKARLVYQALVYQIAKEIGAMATTLQGKVDAIVLTGGMANSRNFIKKIKQRVKFLAHVLVFPGEDEMEALTWGALRVLKGEEKAKEY